jgi:hypothetical protein
MPLSSAQRAWIAVLIFFLLVVAGLGGFYYWEIHRPAPAGPAFSPEIAGPPPDVLSVLPPDAPVVGFIDAEALRKLPNFSLAGFVSLMFSGPQSQRAYNDFIRGTGFDVSRDLDHAAVAYWPTGFGKPDNVLGQDRFVAVADGRFDQPRIKAYIAHLGGKQVVHGTQSIFQAPGNPPISLEFMLPMPFPMGLARAMPPCSYAFRKSVARRYSPSRRPIIFHKASMPISRTRRSSINSLAAFARSLSSASPLETC